MDIFELFKKIENKENSPSAKAVTRMLVGLGNPGDKYKTTRHNAGFLALGYATEKWNCRATNVKFDSLVGECVISNERTLVVFPQTFMNNSGLAVAKAAKFYKIEPQNIIVVYDDISLDVGKMRIRKKGSAGGHNGIKSIIENLGSDEFPRIKIGVGKKPHADTDLADWVLSSFSNEEMKTLGNVFENTEKAITLINEGKIDKAMNDFNS